MASPVGVMSVLGLSDGLGAGSVLDGFTGFTGKIADAGDEADLGAAGLGAATGLGDAAFEIKEAAKTAPAVSKAERLKLIFSPKAELIKKRNCCQHIVRCLA